MINPKTNEKWIGLKLEVIPKMENLGNKPNPIINQ